MSACKLTSVKFICLLCVCYQTEHVYGIADVSGSHKTSLSQGDA